MGQPSPHCTETLCQVPRPTRSPASDVSRLYSHSSRTTHYSIQDATGQTETANSPSLFDATTKTSIPVPETISTSQDPSSNETDIRVQDTQPLANLPCYEAIDLLFSPVIPIRSTLRHERLQAPVRTHQPETRYYHQLDPFLPQTPRSIPH
jgi:hypothetical protein